MTFSDLKWKTVPLYFDNQDTNFFGEDASACFIQLVTLTGEEPSTDELERDFFQRKGLCPSKAIFILRSVVPNDDNLGDITISSAAVEEIRNFTLPTTTTSAATEEINNLAIR